MQRDFLRWLLLFLLLGLFGGFAWFSRYPESPWLERAQRWPVVGDLAHRFRATWLAPAVPERSATEVEPHKAEPLPKPRLMPLSEHRPSQSPSSPGLTIDAADIADVSTLADPSAAISQTTPAHLPAPVKVLEWIWCLPGSTIHAAPVEHAAARVRLGSMAYLPVLARQGGWAQIIHRGEKGWLDTTWKPEPVGQDGERGILRERGERVLASDSRRLEAARAILGTDLPSRTLGRYQLLTDVADEPLLDFLDRVAVSVEPAYVARYGRVPSGDPTQTAVLFARGIDYLEFSERLDVLTDFHAVHAAGGVLALFAERRERDDLASTLVHEITHLLNDRALSGRLPLWLDEGMASDLGGVWIEPDPAMRKERSRAPRLPNGDELRGLELRRLLDMGEVPGVEQLTSLDPAVVRGPVRRFIYAHGAWLVRYLLDGKNGRWAEGFCAFLGRIATGLSAEPGALLASLGVDAATLDQGFRDWLAIELRRREAAREAEGVIVDVYRQDPEDARPEPE